MPKPPRLKSEPEYHGKRHKEHGSNTSVCKCIASKHTQTFCLTLWIPRNSVFIFPPRALVFVYCVCCVVVRCVGSGELITRPEESYRVCVCVCVCVCVHIYTSILTVVRNTSIHRVGLESPFMIKQVVYIVTIVLWRTKVLLNYYECLESTFGFLGAFEKLRKTTNSFFISVRLSVRTEQLGLHWKYFN
jgi:hypothetical protein